MAHQSAEVELRWSAAKMSVVMSNSKRRSGELCWFPLTIRAPAAYSQRPTFSSFGVLKEYSFGIRRSRFKNVNEKLNINQVQLEELTFPRLAPPLANTTGGNGSDGIFLLRIFHSFSPGRGDFSASFHPERHPKRGNFQEQRILHDLIHLPLHKVNPPFKSRAGHHFIKSWKLIHP